MMRKIIIAGIIITALLFATAVPVAAADTDNPRLVLSSYAINGGSTDSVTTGSFTLDYTLLNTSGIALVNTILTYEQKSSYIVPVHGRSNAEYIGDINASQMYEGKLDLYVPEDAPTGYHRFEITLSYNLAVQSIVSQITWSFSVYIYISNNPGLVLRRIELSDEMTGGGRRFLYIEYENPGSVDFRNLQLVIEGNIYEQHKTQTLPILNAGRSNSIEYPVQFTDTGTQYIDVFITYSDDAGNQHQTQVVSKQADISGTETPESAAPGNPRAEGYISRLFRILLRNMRTPAFLLAFAVSAAVITAIAITITRIRRQAIRKKWYFKKPTIKTR